MSGRPEPLLHALEEQVPCLSLHSAHSASSPTQVTANLTVYLPTERASVAPPLLPFVERPRVPEDRRTLDALRVIC